MIGDSDWRAEQYLKRLSDEDLALVAQSSPELAHRRDAVGQLRTHPEDIESLLQDPRTFEAVFANLDDGAEVRIISPFLLFAVAVHRVADELERANYITEWFGPRERMPVFDVEQLRTFLANFHHRLFLTELLSSYTHVSSGSVVVSTPRGLRRQRFSELDLVHLASMIETVMEPDRPMVYRRLGDLALFLTGVFPDHTALKGLSDIDQARLLRSAGLRPGQLREPCGPEIGHAGAVGIIERLGARWYQRASDLDPFAPPGHAQLLDGLATNFSDARRVLNVMTDSFLFPWRSRWFGIAS